MRIGVRVFMVGGIPIAIAASIALAAVLLSNQADKARNGAVLAGAVYGNLLGAVTSRNDYINAVPDNRYHYATQFRDYARRAGTDLATLHELGPLNDRQSTLSAQAALSRYVEDMDKLVTVTASNDGLIAGMAARATLLISLADQARQRQHASNADIVGSLAEGDRKLRSARDIVDAAYSLRIAVVSMQTEQLSFGMASDPEERAELNRKLSFELARLRHISSDLADLVQRSELSESGNDPGGIGLRQARRLAAFKSETDGGQLAANWKIIAQDLLRDLATWAERLIKVNSAEYRSMQDEAAQLLTYSVQAHDTEQATQNVAIQTLKLLNRTSEALTRRDQPASRAVLDESRTLSDTIAALPISPLIQTEMIDAFKRWREGLETTTQGLAQQNGLVATMDDAAAHMIEAARSLDAKFTGNAERIGQFVRTMLLLGAGVGLFLGAAAALLVARSITKPLSRLQLRMTELAAGTGTEFITEDHRKDELGDMARATNVFLQEISRRERVIRKAKERADQALERLRLTQAELIQAEKLASLGELVAGVAHEINTPLGVALTTATVLDDEVGQFEALVQARQISRSAINRLVERMAEGAGLLTINLTRAADLVQAFKNVAADQVRGDRRPFAVAKWLNELLTSLGPMLRKSGHSVSMECSSDLVLDSYPGALAQVATNLIVNASLHAFVPEQAGQIGLTVRASGQDQVQIVVSDNGIGIPPDLRGRIFDPFFTTRRSEGSTGLGLHIVYNLVTSTLQGRIQVDTTPGRGTRFIIEIPLRLPVEGEVAHDFAGKLS